MGGFNMRSTHTYVELEISQSAFDEIAQKLKAADYGHAFMDARTIDMHGIAVTQGPAGKDFEAIFNDHTKAVEAFLNELYAIMVDPLAEGQIKVKDMMAALKEAALRDREKWGSPEREVNEYIAAQTTDEGLPLNPDFKFCAGCDCSLSPPFKTINGLNYCFTCARDVE
jgi:hypothetical protein